MSDQINVNQLSNALQQKVDLPSGKSQADIDYVVEWQAPTSSNNYTWYRKYKSGWVEQGGEYTSSADSAQTITLMIKMADTHYNVSTQRDTISDFNTNINGRWQEVYNRTTTSFTTWGTYSSKPTIMWEVKGMAATS